MKKLLWLFSFFCLINLSYGNNIPFKTLIAQITCSTQTVCTSGKISLGGPVTINIVPGVIPPVCSVSISPLIASITINSTQQFNDSTSGCTPATVHWQVNGINGGNAIIGTISGAGLYTAPAAVPNPSTVNVIAVSDADNTKTASALIIISSNISPENEFCLPGNVVNFGGTMDGPAHYPVDCNYTDLSGTPSPGTIRTITDAASWTSQWAAAQCGDTLEISSGLTLTATKWTIPVTPTCDNNHWITLRTSGWASLPGQYSKVTPCYFGIASINGYPNFNCVSTTKVGATLQSTGTNKTLIFSANNSFIRIIGIEIARTAGTGKVSNQIDIQAGGIHDIIFDRVWGHGEYPDETNGFISLNAVHHISFINDFFSDYISINGANGGTGSDAHAFGGGDNSSLTDNDRSFKIVNCFIAASTENILMGGGAATVVVPESGEIRSNYFYKPLGWNASDGSFFGQQGIIVKNLIEFKTGKKWLVQGNVFENNWAGFSQFGAAMLISPKNQFNGTTGICPICQIHDIIVRYNVFHTTNQWLQLHNGQAGGVTGFYAVGGDSYSIHDNVVDNLKYVTCFDCTSESIIQLTEATTIPSNDISHDITINHNTQVYSSSAPINFERAALSISGALPTSTNHQFNIVYTNNIATAGNTGAANSFGGNDTTNCANKLTLSTTPDIIDNCWVPNTFGGNSFVADGGLPWPGGDIASGGTNCLSESSETNVYVNWNNGLRGDYHIKPTSTCHNTALDGTDPGANINLVNQFTQGVDTF